MALIVAALASVLGGGCARTAEERQLDDMRVDIERLQSERDYADEATLPSPASSARGDLTPAASAAPPPPPPAPSEVVRVGVGGDVEDSDYADPEDVTPRPRIRVFGAPRVHGQDVEQLVDDGAEASSAAVSASPPLDPEAKRAYDAALSLFASRQYERALDGLAAFLIRWPDHPYACHAMYWRGECYFARGDYARAAEQFEGVLARFPSGAKAPDALFKLGQTYLKLNEPAKAKECFSRLSTEYPDTEAAHRIPAENKP